MGNSRIGRAIATVVGGLALAAGVYLWTPAPAPFDRAAAREAATTYDARVLRDRFGVPHIYGARNQDVAFGFGYAHAEDDWKTFEEIILFSRGALAARTGKEGAITDYLIAALGVERAIATKYESDIAPETKAILEGYAAGLNLWCAEAAKRCARGIAPVTARDIVAGFVSRTPFFYGLEDTLKSILEGEGGASGREAFFRLAPGAEFGSNAMAVSPKRANDGHTRLMVNSHQPFTGPVAWYEARLKSEEGWDAIGAVFPGAPMILVGARPELGWAFTVNAPDLVDAYALVVDNNKNPKRYRLDGEWRAFEMGQARFRVKLAGPFSLPVARATRRTVHGPVFETPGGWVAVAYANDRDIRAVEQWRRINFARDYGEWRAAFEMLAIPSFNAVYADRTGLIAYHYNAALSVRATGVDWSGVVPGDDSALVWGARRAFADLPSVVDPASGYVGNANNAPFEAAVAGDAPDPGAFPPAFGIDRRATNRGLRLLELYGADASISGAEFDAYKMDVRYADGSQLVKLVEDILADETLRKDAALAPALEVLRGWDRTASAHSRGAALAILTGQGALGYTLSGEGGPTSDKAEALRRAAEGLQRGFGRLDPEWGAVNRLRRGAVDLAVDGGPDTLRAIYALGDAAKGPLTASYGDTFIMSVDWDSAGTQTLRTIHQFGAATLNAGSPHYADQAPIFAAREWKTPPMTLEAVVAEATRDYRPGKSSGD